MSFNLKSFLSRIFLFGITVSILFVFFGLSTTSAQSNSWELKGWAWNDSYGWASMNCLNAKDGVICGNDGELSGAEDIDYGVALLLDDLTLTGYAWSTGVGWISFNKEDVLKLADECPHQNPAPRLIYTEVNDMHLEGCAVALLGEEVISLGKGSDTSVDYGVQIRLDTPTSSLGDAYALTLHGCAWSDRSGWWSFGDKGGTAKCFSRSNSISHSAKTDNNIIASRLSVSKEIALFGEPIEVSWGCGAPRRLISSEGLPSADEGKISGGYRYIVSSAEKIFKINCGDTIFGFSELQETIKADVTRVSLSADPEFLNPAEGTDVVVSWSFEVFERGVTVASRPCTLNGHPVVKSGSLDADVEGFISVEGIRDETEYTLACGYTKDGKTENTQRKIAVRALPDPEQVRERSE